MPVVPVRGSGSNASYAVNLRSDMASLSRVVESVEMTPEGIPPFAVVGLAPVAEGARILAARPCKKLALVAKDARNEVAHYIGEMATHDALRHLANVRQLLKDLDATPAVTQGYGLYQEQIDSMRQPVQVT